ncbi:hypothetical protein JOD31_000825 [Methylopila capsulata]|uniref:Membrane protein n=1 Tax=Methylopila capsulata TaxID=61654 RepID=A0A9W6ISV0_9HYPH|nr:DUF1214 domain-containing protein [Methylopila capsulata]MBM7850613.1 hypothetical protein [Methylopila capsulata]GLK55906.1 membrane protein [Methylopila capsulata]
MRLTLLVMIVFAVAAVLGLGATLRAVTHGLPFSGLTIGPWRADPDIGGLGADPYLRAGVARRGEAPLAYGDGVEFEARTDDAGRALDAACDYTLEGDLPAARLWTLAPFSPDGRRLETALGRRGTSSAETVRLVGRPIAVELSQTAKAGDWIQLPVKGAFTLRLALYDTALGTPLARRTPPQLLSIKRGACR